MTQSPTSIIVYCDGGCSKSRMYASVKIGDTILRLADLGEGTSNLAEYLALNAALTTALNLGHRSVVVRFDSEVVRRQVLGECGTTNTSLKFWRDSIRRSLKRFDSVELVHVPRGLIVRELGH